MKISSLSILILAALISATSCVKDYDGPSVQVSDRLVQVTFTASGLLTRTLLSDRMVSWESTDRISLFSGENLATKTELSIKDMYEDGSKAEFEGLAAYGSESYVAVYPSADVNAYDGSTLTLAIPSQQAAVAGGFMSGANTTVAVSSGNDLIFKNVGALIGICLEPADASITTSIKLRLKKSDTEYAGISGIAEVALDPESGIPSAGEGSADHVVITAPAGGFVAGKTYYAVVYPGTYTGFELVLTQNGKDVVKSENRHLTLDRSSMVTISLSPVAGQDLPKKFTLTIDFTKGWPFVETPSTEFAAAGEEYTYSYEYDATKSPLNITFVISTRGKGNYAYVESTDGADGYLAMPAEAATSNRYGAVSIPPVIGRYPESVAVRTNSKAWLVGLGGFTRFSTVSASTQSAKVFPVNIFNSESTFILPVGTAFSTLRDCSIGMRFPSTNIYSISIAYTDVRPE